MSDHHRYFLDHTPKQSIEWAETIGENMTIFIRTLLNQRSEKQALTQIMHIRHLEKRFEIDEMENAAQRLLLATHNPTLSVYKTILNRNKKRADAKDTNNSLSDKTNESYGFVRGANYYGGKK